MKEKILALLLAKFAGVRKDALAQLARSLALQATTEDEANSVVEKLTSDQVNDFAKDYRKDVDKEVSDANKTYKKNIEEKFDLVEKKEPADPDPNKKTDPNDIAAIVAAAVSKAVEPLQQKLSSFEGAKTSETRLQQLQAKFAEKNLPESFTAQKLKDFKRMNFESEEAFAEYLTETESDITAFNQELSDKGLLGQAMPRFGAANKEGVSQGVADFITAKTEPAKNLGGKEI